MSVNIKQNGALTKISGLYNAYNGAPDYYVETTQTLSTTGDTTFTFTDNKIHTSSAVSPYTSIFGMNPKSMTISEGQCVVVFPAYSEAVAMSCRLYIKSSGTGSNSPTNYSTEKVAVGTWIDGRTVYQQTIIIDNITATGTKSTYINHANMIIDIQAFLHVGYDLTNVSTGDVTRIYNEYMCSFNYDGSNTSSLSFLDSVTIYNNSINKSVNFGFMVSKLPSSTGSFTVSNMDAKIYATIQFVEAES